MDNLKPGEVGYWCVEGIPIKITRIRISDYVFDEKDYKVLAYDKVEQRKFPLSEVWRSGGSITKKQFDILVEIKKYLMEITKVEGKESITEKDKNRIKELKTKIGKCNIKYNNEEDKNIKKWQSMENLGIGEILYLNNKSIPVKIIRTKIINTYNLTVEDFDIFAYDTLPPRKISFLEIYTYGVLINKKQFDILIKKNKHKIKN